jgi:hypothetical protein
MIWLVRPAGDAVSDFGDVVSNAILVVVPCFGASIFSCVAA